MTLAASYARALYELVLEDPSKATTFSAHLQSGLTKRGHLKLLPAIVREYEKLEVQEARSTLHSTVTPEKERVRVLLGLYKKLVDTN